MLTGMDEMRTAMTRAIDYGGMMHRAMQGLIAEVLTRVAKEGLPGEHHFFITFDTREDGVEIADWLRERYPSEMTIVIQHWYEELRLTDDGCYAITPKGLRNSEICESSLPYSVRIRTDKNVAAYNKKLLRRSQVRARVTPRENGTFTVELSFHDDVDELMQLQVMVATEAMAKDLAARFEKNPEQIYTQLMSVLYGG